MCSMSGSLLALSGGFGQFLHWENLLPRKSHAKNRLDSDNSKPDDTDNSKPDNFVKIAWLETLSCAQLLERLQAQSISGWLCTLVALNRRFWIENRVLLNRAIRIRRSPRSLRSRWNIDSCVAIQIGASESIFRELFRTVCNRAGPI